MYNFWSLIVIENNKQSQLSHRSQVYKLNGNKKRWIKQWEKIEFSINSSHYKISTTIASTPKPLSSPSSPTSKVMPNSLTLTTYCWMTSSIVMSEILIMPKSLDWLTSHPIIKSTLMRKRCTFCKELRRLRSLLWGFMAKRGRERVYFLTKFLIWQV